MIYFQIIVAKLPKWFGERPGKKSGDPESPDDDGEGANTALEVEEDEEEAPQEEEEEEEEEEEVNYRIHSNRGRP